MAGTGVIGAAGRADAGAFLARLVQLDPAAVVRLRPVRSGVAEVAGLSEIWAMLPFGVLVVRALPVRIDADATVDAAALLQTLRVPAAGAPTVDAPRRRDEAWQWPLPPSSGRVVETVPADEVGRIAAAASRTLRTASEQGVGGRVVGERVVRDALLDHVPIVVTSAAGERIDVPQRLVQAVVRMGFLGPPLPGPGGTEVTFGEAVVAVRSVGTWVGLGAPYGSAWYQPTSPLQMA